MIDFKTCQPLKQKLSARPRNLPPEELTHESSCFPNVAFEACEESKPFSSNIPEQSLWRSPPHHRNIFALTHLPTKTWPEAFPNKHERNALLHRNRTTP